MNPQTGKSALRKRPRRSAGFPACGFWLRVGVKPAPVNALSVESGLEGPGWAEHEFADCELGDKRLTQRLVKIVCEQAAQPEGSYAQAAAGHRHDLKGYYRFLNNERSELNLESILQTHRAQTIRRMKPSLRPRAGRRCRPERPESKFDSKRSR